MIGAFMEIDMSKKADAVMKQKLLEERDRLFRERDAIDNQIKGLERAIALIDADDEDAGTHMGRGGVKSLVLDLLNEVGTTGLNALTAVDLAERRGIKLARDSVSSLLSRMKKDELVVYDGEKYRLVQFARPKDGSEQERQNVRIFSVTRG